MSRDLFDTSNNSDNEIGLTTNNDYAKSYNSFRKKELLKKFKDRGYNVDETFSSTDSSESSDEDHLDEKFDTAFFKTLASLKSKDPSIYDKKTEFFEDSKVHEKEFVESDGYKEHKKKENRSKPMLLKDYERKVILEKDGKFEDSDEEIDDSNHRSTSPTVIEEEKRLKEEFKKVLNSEDSDEEEFGGIFKKRVKTKEENHKEENDFTKWLAGKKDHIEEIDKEKLEPLKTYWNSNKLPQSERFLRDYILNYGYSNTDPNQIPTYDEVVGDTTHLSEDEEELEKQAEFEQKYNFRFEEPDTEFIKRYPRTIESSVRSTDDKRKQKRQELKNRKLEEKHEKMKQLDIVKELKRKEIEEKIRMLKMVTGNEQLGFKNEELEEDFDPEAHDRRMNELFNDEYYQVDEGEEKPECPSEIDDLKFEDWDSYNPKEVSENYCDGSKELHCDDDDFNMDCDYDPIGSKQGLQNELIENTKGRRNRKSRRNHFMEMIQAKKPEFNPDDEKTYAEYIDEYYKMDCEDIIGDLPCRFKYVETTPCDFGLTIEEILLAKNKELNQWASLKKTVQIRPDHVEKREQKIYKMKAKNEELKRKIFKSLYGDGSDNEENNSNEKPFRKEDSPSITTHSIEYPKKNRRRKRKTNNRESIPSVTLLNGSLDNMAEKSLMKRPEEALKNQHDTPALVGREKKGKKQIKKDDPPKRHNIMKLNSPIECGNNHNPFKATNKISKNDPKSSAIYKKDRKDIIETEKFQRKNAKVQKRDNLMQTRNTEISDERLKAYGINPRKFHKKQKFEKKYS